MGQKQKRRRKHRGHDGSEIWNELNDSEKSHCTDAFQKHFCYTTRKTADWKLTDAQLIFTSPPWKDDRLYTWKHELNVMKSGLSRYPIEQWHEHTQHTNLAGHVMQRLRQRVRPELCTQAWCKFYEILGTFDIVPNCNAAFSSVHLCEAPGGFITSLNHYLKSTGHTGVWNWMGVTLNPYYESNSLSAMVIDDRFIFDTLSNWYFGEDNTGDVMAIDNLIGLKQATGCLENVCLESIVFSHNLLDVLVTADGSIDCADNPGQQEQMTSQLHLCEVITALHILTPGGNIVVKMFTLFEDSSVCLMYILNCLFQQVHVTKPASSKSGNSEVYIVAKQFNGLSQQLLDQLQYFMGHYKSDSLMFNKTDIPDSFLSVHYDCCQFFMQLQTDTILANINCYTPSFSQLDHVTLERLKHYTAATYLERLQLHPIPKESRIVTEFWLSAKMRHLRSNQPAMFRKRHQGSFFQRQIHNRLPWRQRVAEMNLYDVDSQADIAWFQTHCLIEPTSFCHPSELKTDPDTADCRGITRGRHLTRVLSSKFCDQQLLNHLNDFLENSQHFSKEDSHSFHEQRKNSSLSKTSCEEVRDQTPGKSPTALETVEQLQTVTEKSSNLAARSGHHSAEGHNKPTLESTQLSAAEYDKQTVLPSQRCAPECSRPTFTESSPCSAKCTRKTVGPFQQFAEAVTQQNTVSCQEATIKVVPTTCCSVKDNLNVINTGNMRGPFYKFLKDYASRQETDREQKVCCCEELCALPWDAGQSWTRTHLELLQQLNSMIKMLQGTHGCSVLLTPPPLTRFSVAIWRMIYSLFQKVSVLHGNVDDRPLLYITGLEFRGCPDDLSSYLEFVERTMTSQKQCTSSSHDVLQITSIECLFEPEFFTMVCDANNIFMKRYINCLIEEEKRTLSLNCTQDLS